MRAALSPLASWPVPCLLGPDCWPWRLVGLLAGLSSPSWLAQVCSSQPTVPCGSQSQGTASVELWAKLSEMNGAVTGKENSWTASPCQHLSLLSPQMLWRGSEELGTQRHTQSELFPGSLWFLNVLGSTPLPPFFLQKDSLRWDQGSDHILGSLSGNPVHAFPLLLWTIGPVLPTTVKSSQPLEGRG